MKIPRNPMKMLRKFDPIDGWLICLSTVWTLLVLMTPYVPSQDGPSHVYCAYALSNLDTPPYSGLYEATWELIPNLGGTALLMLLGAVMPWPLAEKILVLIATLGFIVGTRWLCRSQRPSDDSGTPTVALFAVPFALTAPLFYGFYSYSLGLAFVPWVWGLATQRGAKARLLLATLCFATWACHAAACLIALIGAVILGFTRDKKQQLYLIVSLIPAAGLLGYSIVSFPTQSAVHWDWARLSEYAVLGRAFFVFEGGAEWTSVLCIGALLSYALRATHVIRPMTLTAGLIALYAWLPDGGSEHWFLSLRLSMLPAYSLLILASQRTPPHKLLNFGLAALVTVHLATVCIGYQQASQQIEDYVSLEAHVPDGANILVIDDLGPPYPSRHNPLLHAAGWLAINRRGIDVSNYEPHRRHFQLKLMKYSQIPDPNALMDALTVQSITPFLRHSDTVLYRSDKPIQLGGFVSHASAENVHVFLGRECKRHRH